MSHQVDLEIKYKFNKVLWKKKSWVLTHECHECGKPKARNHPRKNSNDNLLLKSIPKWVGFMAMGLPHQRKCDFQRDMGQNQWNVSSFLAEM